MDFLGWIDLLMGPFYCALFYFIIKNRQTTKYGNSLPTQKYYARGFLIKAAGAMFVGLVYQFYYGGGDTATYFQDSKVITGYFFKNIDDWWTLITFGKGDYQTSPIVWRVWGITYLRDPNSMTVDQVNSIFNFFTFGSYMGDAMFFALISFYATWKFYTMLVEMYPKEWDTLGKIVFYIPSVMFWGSGIFKDTLTYSAMLLLVYHTYQLFIKKRFSIRSYVEIIIWAILISKIRMFFLALIIPCLAMWVVVSLSDSFRSKFLKQITFPVFLGIAIIGILFGLPRYMESSDTMNLEALQKKSEGFQSWHTTVGGSSYSLGEIEYTAGGILRAFPAAVNVSLFRPYVWETRSFFMLITALQSLFFALYTIRTIFRVKFFLFFKTLLSNSFALFCLTLSLFFAFACGFTSFNFGALDRYKIPALTLYLLGIFLVEVDNKYIKFKTDKV